MEYAPQHSILAFYEDKLKYGLLFVTVECMQHSFDSETLVRIFHNKVMCGIPSSNRINFSVAWNNYMMYTHIL